MSDHESKASLVFFKQEHISYVNTPGGQDATTTRRGFPHVMNVERRCVGVAKIVDSEFSYYCAECGREYSPTDAAAKLQLCVVDGNQLFKLPAELAPGTVIDGRYTILKPLGRGGMGIVFVARHHANEDHVAIKMIDTQLSSDVLVRRFLREARATMRIDHPGVVKVRDLGQTAAGQPYMVMEIMEGESLDVTLEREGALQPGRALRIAAQVASALAATHEHDILHRDLKPSNIMVHRDDDGVEHVKVFDFGLAKSVQDETGELGKLTGTGMLIGTPRYMSPEQFRGIELGPASDLYALGCVLYEMLTGDLPFVGENVFVIMRSHLGEPPTPIIELPGCAEISPKVNELCLQMLEKEADKRPPNTAALARDLLELADADEGLAARSQPETAAPEFAESQELVKPSLTPPRGVFKTLEFVAERQFRPPLVGRERTRGFLQTTLRTSVDELRPAVIMLEGSAGVGKSKLVEWYHGRGEQAGCRVVHGYHSEGNLGAHAALKDVIEGLLGVVGEPWENIAPRLEALTVPGPDPDGPPERLNARERELLHQFLRPQVEQSNEQHGFEHQGFAPEDRELLYETLLRTIRWAAWGQPTLVIMDDLRDHRSFDHAFLDRLGGQLHGTRQALVILMAVRTEEVPEAASADRPNTDALTRSAVMSLGQILGEQFFRVKIKPLNTPEVETLVTKALPGISPSATARVAQLTGGNPLFALQLLRNMVGEGSLRRADRGWEIFGEPTLPADMGSLLDARLERLAGRLREEALLVRAALIGPRVPVALLEDVLNREGKFELLDDLNSLLERLINDGWLHDAESWQEDAVIFEHGFVQEGIRDRYGSKRPARKIHGAVAEAFEQYHAHALGPVASKIAGHHFVAGNYDRALSFFSRAGRAAERRYAIQEAIGTWRRAQECLARASAPDKATARVRRGLARTLIYNSEHTEAREILDLLGDEPETLELRGDLANALAEYVAAQTFYKAAVTAFEDSQSLAPLSRLLVKSAIIHNKLADHVTGIATSKTALEIAERLGSKPLRASALNQLAMNSMLLGELDDAVAYMKEEQELCRELGDDVALARSLYTQGGVHWRLSEYRAALAAHGAAIPLLERAGHHTGLGHCLRVAGSCAQHLGRLDEALAYCRRAQGLFERIKDPRGLQRNALSFADAYCARGEHTEAIEWAERALKLAQDLDDPLAIRAGFVTIGEVHLASGEFHAAIEFFERAMEMMDPSNWICAFAHEKLGEALSSVGEVESAKDHFRRAIDIYTKLGNIKAATAAQQKLEET